jgi:hypothetical protein
LKITVIRPPSAEFSTTWLLVTIRPSPSRMNPEPPVPLLPLPDLIMTVLGSAFLATSTVFATGGAGGSGSRELVVVPGGTEVVGC